MAVTTTSFATGPWEKHRVWYEMLHGNRGLIIWDDKAAFVGAAVENGQLMVDVDGHGSKVAARSATIRPPDSGEGRIGLEQSTNSSAKRHVAA